MGATPIASDLERSWADREGGGSPGGRGGGATCTSSTEAEIEAEVTSRSQRF